MDYKVGNLNQLSKELHSFQIQAGFTDSNITQRLMLVHSEITEAFEAFREGKMADIELFNYNQEEHGVDWKLAFEAEIKDSMEDEIADAIIRLLAFCSENNIDIEFHINEKMKYNALRGFKYGGKKF